MSTTDLNKNARKDANLDPLSGAPGAHPVGTGVGAAAGGVVAGALAGTVAGPVGTLVGAAVGAVAGGLAGKGIAEMIDPTAEEAYWRENYSNARMLWTARLSTTTVRPIAMVSIRMRDTVPDHSATPSPN